MNTKTIIIVVIISILIGLAIFFAPKLLTQTPKLTSSTANPPAKTNLTSPTPLPNPNPPTIDESSNLKEEINKLTIPNFTEDFKKLKEEIN